MPRISIDQAEFRREEKVSDKKSLSLSSLKNDYLNLKNLEKATERANFAHSKRGHCGGPHPTENASNNSGQKRERNSTCVTTKTNAMQVTIGNPIRVSDVDWRITEL